MTPALTLPTTWTPIATRSRFRRDDWREIADSPLSLADARRMLDMGDLLMATRYEPARAVVVVKGRGA